MAKRIHKAIDGDGGCRIDCGRGGTISKFTTDPARVTCKRCLKIYAAMFKRLEK